MSDRVRLAEAEADALAVLEGNDLDWRAESDEAALEIEAELATLKQKSEEGKKM